MNTRMKTNSLLFFVLLALVSCGEKKTDKNQETAVPVEVTTPTVYTNSDVLTNGVIESKEIAQIGTRVMGYVQRINVTQGQSVQKGTLLISISDNELKAKLAQAKAMQAQAKAAYEVAAKDEARYKRLLERKSCSPKEYEQIHLRYQAMKASLKAAQQGVKEVMVHRNYTQIVAPFSGTIATVSTKEGSLATPGTPLLTLEKAGVMVIQTQLSENYVQAVKPGMLARVRVEGRAETFEAPVSERSLSSVATGGQYQVTLAVPKALQKDLMSGLHVTVSFTLPNQQALAHQIIRIPQKVIYTQGALQGVYIVSADQRALLRWLRLGNVSGDQVEVLAGLNPEDQVIIPTADRMHNGMKVTIK